MKAIRDQIGEQGYCVVDGIEAKTVAALRSRFFEVWHGVASAHDWGAVRTDVDLVRLYQTRKDIWIAAVEQFPYLPDLVGQSANPKLVELAQAAGVRSPAISGFGVALLVNMPDDDKRLYRAHQDITFIPGSLNGVTIWVPLQDSPVPLGPLEVVPGSHKLGLLPTNGVTDVKQNELLEPFPDEAFIPVPIVAGQCILFSKFLVHRSGRNRTQAVRISLQFRYNDLASPEYQSRLLTFSHLDPTSKAMRYTIDA